VVVVVASGGFGFIVVVVVLGGGGAHGLAASSGMHPLSALRMTRSRLTGPVPPRNRSV
jgi:hypothetical protein